MGGGISDSDNEIYFWHWIFVGGCKRFAEVLLFTYSYQETQFHLFLYFQYPK